MNSDLQSSQMYTENWYHPATANLWRDCLLLARPQRLPDWSCSVQVCPRAARTVLLTSQARCPAKLSCAASPTSTAGINTLRRIAAPRTNVSVPAPRTADSWQVGPLLLLYTLWWGFGAPPGQFWLGRVCLQCFVFVLSIRTIAGVSAVVSLLTRNSAIAARPAARASTAAAAVQRWQIPEDYVGSSSIAETNQTKQGHFLI